MSRSLVGFAVVALTAALSLACTGSLPGEAPDAWANRIAEAYDTRQLLPKTSARSAKGVAEAMDAWDPSFKKVLGKSADGSGYALNVFTVVQRVDDIWTKDELNKSMVTTIGNRIAAIPPNEVERWMKALSDVQKDEVSELWSVVLVARTSTLFGGPNGALDGVAAERVMARLKTIPEPALADLSKSLGTGKADAALRVAENDRFFDATGAIRQSELDQAVAAVKSLRPVSTTAKP